MRKFGWWLGATLLVLLLILSISVVAGAYLVVATEPSVYPVSLAKADMSEASFQERAALERFPAQAPEIMATFGEDPTFQRMLREYGHNSTFPIIWKCLSDGDDILDASHAMLSAGRSLYKLRFPESPRRLSSMECAKHAIAMIDTLGHDFLRLYKRDQQDMAHGLPAKAVIALVGDVLTSGIKNFDERRALGQEIRVRDLVWLGVDLAVIGGGTFGAVTKLPSFGKGASVAKGTRVGGRIVQAVSEVGTRTAQVAPWLTAKYAITAAKYTAVGAIAYMAWFHPDVVTGYVGTVAKSLGFNPFLIQTLFWSGVIFVILAMTAPVWLPILMGLLVLLRIYRLVRVR